MAVALEVCLVFCPKSRCLSFVRTYAPKIAQYKTKCLNYRVMWSNPNQWIVRILSNMWIYAIKISSKPDKMSIQQGHGIKPQLSWLLARKKHWWGLLKPSLYECIGSFKGRYKNSVYALLQAFTGGCKQPPFVCIPLKPLIQFLNRWIINL